MNPSATRFDFARLQKEMQDRILDVLDACEENSMSCRCEMVGSDFTIIVGRGYSAPGHWIKMLTGGTPT